VLVERPRAVEEICGWVTISRQRAQQGGEIVPPRVASARHVKGLARLLGRLLSGESGPLQMTLARGESGVVQIEPRLA
jgi:hypothetical protein